MSKASSDAELFEWVYGPARTGDEMPVLHEHFRTTLFNGRAWLSKAEAQMHAARLLFERWNATFTQFSRGENVHPLELGLGSAGLMHAGYAIELALKAVLVAELTTESDTSQLPKRLKSHDLVSLCNQADISLSAPEALLAARLEQVIVWAGRYPIPLDPDAYRRAATKSGDSAIPGISTGDLDACTALFARVRSAFDARMR